MHSRRLISQLPTTISSFVRIVFGGKNPLARFSLLHFDHKMIYPVFLALQ